MALVTLLDVIDGVPDDSSVCRDKPSSMVAGFMSLGRELWVEIVYGPSCWRFTSNDSFGGVKVKSKSRTRSLNTTFINWWPYPRRSRPVASSTGFCHRET